MAPTQTEILAKVSELELDGRKISTVVEGRAFINGKYVEALSGEWLASVNPATGKEVARIASCDKADVDAAVSAARSTFVSGVWRKTSAAERRTVMTKLADLLEKHALELSVYETIEGGIPINDNLEFNHPIIVENMRYHAEAINKVYGKVSPATSEDRLGIIVREPAGVCGLVVPWNYPLMIALSKVAPALATGNSVVLKPSEMTSLSAIRFARLALDAGVPPGVVNVVPGYGATVGSAIAGHLDVDVCSFTGSTATGRAILRASADSNLKRCALELGGKSPVIVFDDCVGNDEGLDKIAMDVVAAAYSNSAQNCMAGSRLVVQRGIKDKLIAKVLEIIRSGELKIGDPLKLDTFNGPMISSQHMGKVMGYVEKGKAEGAKLLIGGERLANAEEYPSGNFVAHTVFDEVDNSMTIAKDEIFGPVLSVLTFDTEDEAVEMANDTKYGLFAGVYTLNMHRAHRVSHRVESGLVSVNCISEGDDTMPFGGRKQSGFAGCDKSIMAFEQYQEVKTIWHEIPKQS